MKSILVAMFLLTSSVSFATDASSKNEALRVANVILDNPAVVAQLNSKNVNLVDYTVVEDGKGVNTFTFNVDRTCFCAPMPGTLTIVQDLRGTFVDGPIIYSYTLDWAK